MELALTLLRGAVLAVFALAVLAASASWLVRTRRVSPFTTLGQLLRRASEPIIGRVEPRVIRAGYNPVNVGWFLVVGVAVAGILLLTVAEWGLGALGTMMAATAGGPRGFAWVLVNLAYTLTDWLVEPLRRVIPPLGAIDITPLIAWLVLMVGRRILGGILF